jgi:hypothetical protein
MKDILFYPQTYRENVIPGSPRIRRMIAYGSILYKLNMELDPQSLFGLHVHSCTHWLRPRNPIPPYPRIWAHIRGCYWPAKIN